MPAEDAVEGFRISRAKLFQQIARFAFRDVEVGPGREVS